MSKAEVTISFNGKLDKKEKYIVNFPNGINANAENAERIMREALCLSEYQELYVLYIKIL